VASVHAVCFLPLLVPRIPPAQGVPANHKHVEEHFQPVAEHVDFGGGRVAPAHWDFHGAQAVLV